MTKYMCVSAKLLQNTVEPNIVGSHFMDTCSRNLVADTDNNGDVWLVT